MTRLSKVVFGFVSIFAILFFAISACQKIPKDVNRASFMNCKLTPPEKGSPSTVGGFPRVAERLRSTGQVNATVIMVDFSDAPATMTPDDAFAKVSGATETFSELSYGRFNFNLVPTKRWYRMSKASSEYSFRFGDTHRAYIKEAAGLADADVDFSSTDVLLILANPDSKEVGQYDTRGPMIAAWPGQGVTLDGKEILSMITSAYDLNGWGSIWLNHETTHAFGLIDLYAFEPSDSSNPYDGLRFTGGYSLMGLSSFTSNAPGLLAWERWVLGWIDDNQVVCANPVKDGPVVASLTSIGSVGGVKAVVVPLDESRAVVVESRRPTGIDKNLAKPGALVYVVDTSVSGGKGAIKVYPAGGIDDPLFLNSTRAVSEFVDVEGIRISINSSDVDGDEVRLVPLNRF